MVVGVINLRIGLDLRINLGTSDSVFSEFVADGISQIGTTFSAGYAPPTVSATLFLGYNIHIKWLGSYRTFWLIEGLLLWGIHFFQQKILIFSLISWFYLLGFFAKISFQNANISITYFSSTWSSLMIRIVLLNMFWSLESFTFYSNVLANDCYGLISNTGC